MCSVDGGIRDDICGFGGHDGHNVVPVVVVDLVDGSVSFSDFVWIFSRLYLRARIRKFSIDTHHRHTQHILPNRNRNNFSAPGVTRPSLFQHKTQRGASPS